MRTPAGFLALFTFLLFGFSDNLYEVPQEPLPNPPIRTCETMEQDSVNQLKYADMRNRLAFEEKIRQKVEELQQRQLSGRTFAEVLTIPMVVHVVHNGEQVGQGRNISAEQVAAQIEVLNEDFRRKEGTPGFNNNPVGADIEIEFCLAALGPNGQELEEPGIHRYNGNRAAWSRSDIEGILKPNTIWNPNDYLNVWTVDFDAEDELLLGYAQFPSDSELSGLPASGGSASTDGVVVRYANFGSAAKGNFSVMSPPYNRGRTLTHEVGHWLGLRHIWGDGPCGSDDFVADTPEAAEPTRGCPNGKTSCGSLDMIQNYMDYSDDACMNIFTQGQKLRIRAVMEVSPRRNSLLNSQVCGEVVAAAPVPDFTSDKQLTLRDGTIRFSDLSSNFPTAWFWTFEGGTPAVSNERNPAVKYTTEGTYDVMLVTANQYGVSDTLVREDYVVVSSEGICGSLSNFGAASENLIPLPSFYEDEPVANPEGYLSGHNSIRTQAVSEYFDNKPGYENLSGVSIKFGKAYSKNPEATAYVVVWNARGPQSSPGAILEQKEVLIREIADDIEANEPTKVVFGRRVPLFGVGFHVGILLNYEEGDTLALLSSADRELGVPTGWEKDAKGEWDLISRGYGLTISHAVTAEVGMDASVQIRTNKLIVNPGESVTLSATGASIFQWETATGNLVTSLGPTVEARPSATATYKVVASGDNLCVAEAEITVYVREVTSVEEPTFEDLSLYPNPVENGIFTIAFQNDYRGMVEVRLYDITGKRLFETRAEKKETVFNHTVQTGRSSGAVIAEIRIGPTVRREKLIFK